MHNRIRELRIGKGLQQEALGREFGISQQTISKIENEKYATPVDLLISFAKYFNVSVDYLLGLSNTKRSLEGQIIVNQAFDEYYDIVVVYKELNNKNRTTLRVLLERLRKSQTEKD